jgi:5-methylcytosine-specific restriction endonuclease McrA
VKVARPVLKERCVAVMRTSTQTDGNHNNWKKNNLLAIHESCHDYIHMGKRESQEHREPDAAKAARPDLIGRGGR